MHYSPSGSSIHGILRQGYWSELLFLSLGNLPHPGIKPASPALQADSLLLSHQGSPPVDYLLLFCLMVDKMHLCRGAELRWGRLFYKSHKKGWLLDCHYILQDGQLSILYLLLTTIACKLLYSVR